MIQVRGHGLTTHDALQAEANALIQALNYVLDQQTLNKGYIIYMYCKVLLKAVHKGQWKTYCHGRQGKM